ncbi:hypothetical protein B0T17DRAFT_520324 [Bombardia bombarda]|uniref:SigF-like NTF2-like domain-containing protein n=1 Tax=Bombardia bombarda TaxID=252184 RepID=A0AA39XMU1_9PEZI|nr:hypothetical protein B0T17DRAFT_520324 [Bombardia bombarda]
MEHPVKDVRGVIRALCQGTPEEQRDAVNRYYLPSASFVHPFCRVPSFEGVKVPLVGELDSRMLLLAVYRWYKILSPKFELEIESTVFDQRAGLLYLTILQTFSIWFIPFHKAPVRLVTVLHLTAPSSQQQASEHNNAKPITNGTVTPNNNNNNNSSSQSATSSDEGFADGDSEPSYAEVASGSAHVPASGESGSSSLAAVAERINGNGSGNGNGTSSLSGSISGGNHSHSHNKYMIKRQEDFYQVNEFLKFLFMAPGALLWSAWQLWSTFFCVVGAVLLGPVARIVGKVGDRAAAATASARARRVGGGGGSNGSAVGRQKVL